MLVERIMTSPCITFNVEGTIEEIITLMHEKISIMSQLLMMTIDCSALLATEILNRHCRQTYKTVLFWI